MHENFPVSLSEEPLGRPIQRDWEELADCVLKRATEYYGVRLLSLAVYGSVARGTARAESDLDCLLLVDPLPDGRGARAREFAEVDRLLAADVERAWCSGISGDISPLFKTPAEMEEGFPLMLDMTDEAVILYDTHEVLRGLLDNFSARLKKAGAVRKRQGLTWVWDLKPDFKPGDKILI